jgi:hypothetical protein
MKIDRTLIGALLIGVLVLSPSAYGITISVGSDAGGFTENINAGDKDGVYSSTVLAANSLSHSIEGSGSLKESHWVSNSAGASAGVGVDIRKAESYKYGYSLTPGSGSHWPASRYPAVSASETLDVANANYINAYANSFNAKGEYAGVSTILVDPGNKASLEGYSNSAGATPEKVAANQNAVSASAPNGFIQTEADSQMDQLRIFPLELKMEKTGASTTVKAGYVDGYIDRAAVLNHELVVSQQHIDSASGKQINSQTKSSFYLASLFNGLRRSNAEVNTMTFGDLTGYDGIGKISQDVVEAQQSGHIEGTFTSTATAGSASKTRSSNYGSDYNFNMQAKKDASGSSVYGTLGYYVDNVSLIANRIQGAVDASQSGDAVNVAPGTYYENVQIDKSLKVLGSGANDTIVDGQQSGSVFTIGKNNPNVDVALSGLTIQGGSGTYTERWLGEPLVQCGGGIWNAGRLSLVDSTVSGNTANEYGSGIWSTGTLTMDRSLIYGNGMPRDGGGIWSSGELIVRDSTVAGNAAYWNGGGIWNSGKMRVEGSNVSGNTVHYYGGGIANDMGEATIVGSTISGNTADLGGGGIYNMLGKVALDDTAISGNTGNVGGGIMNNGEMTVSGGSVSANMATNGSGIFNMGTLDLNGAMVDNNTASENGGGIYNLWGTLNLNRSSISGNRAANGGGVYNYYGTVNMERVSIDHNTERIPDWSIYSGGGVYNLGALNMNDVRIEYNRAVNGGGIVNYGTMNMLGGAVEHNYAVSPGGGIFNLGTISVNNASISNNHGEFGGGINNEGIMDLDNVFISRNTAFIGAGIDNYGTATMHSGSIDHNEAYWGGGIENYGTMNIIDGSISNNIASIGGGIDNEGQFSTVNLDGGSIENNTAYSSGGGIYNFRFNTVNMNGGSIHDNVANYTGGGIFNHGKVNLNGGSISRNEAVDGGGIWNGDTVNLNGSSIDHNTAEYGGGIYNTYSWEQGTVNLNSGSIDHNNATSPSPSGGGIYNLATVVGNTDLVQDNTPDQIAPDVDWLPEV